MSLLRDNYLYVLAALPVLWYAWKAIDYIRNPLRRYPQFPGPKGLPLLGNVLQIQEKQWLRYTGVFVFVQSSRFVLITSFRMAQAIWYDLPA